MHSLSVRSVSQSISFVVFILFVGAWPFKSSAATAYVTADYPVIGVGDTILITVALDTEERNPNTIQGDIRIDDPKGSLEVKDFSLADSDLSQWLKTPSLDTPGRISFIGGQPGGLNKHSALLFKIVVKAQHEGKVVFLPQNLTAFDNDSKATALQTGGRSFTLNVGPQGVVKNQWQEVISKDNEPPQNLTVTIGQDRFAFDGKKFLSISANDKESGIDRFEVAEDKLPPVRSGNTYVLQNQRETSPIRVLAYDKAGNKSEVILTPEVKSYAKIVWIIGILSSISIAFGFYRFYWVRRKQNA